MVTPLNGASATPQIIPQQAASNRAATNQPRPLASDPIAQLIQADATPTDNPQAQTYLAANEAPVNPAVSRAFTARATAAAAPQGRGPVADINSRATFTNGNAATGAELDRVLRHYNSPHVGQGETIARIAREENINPVLLLAVMQKESSYGNKANTPSLKEENIRNPFSVHFNESAEGIKKLRLPNGEHPTFEQSLRGAIRTLKRHAGDSPTPLSTTSKKYCPPHHETWTREVTANYERQMRRIQQ